MSTDPLATVAILDGRLNMEEKKHQEDAWLSGSLSDTILKSINIINTGEEDQMIHIRNNKVVAYLKSIGYQYIHMGSWLAQTRYNQLAYQNINCFGFQFKDELPTIIASNSVLRLVWINRYFLRTSVLDAFAVLKNMPVIPGKPKFIFAHIICPHSPYVFGSNGEKLGLWAAESNDTNQLYLDQHAFITKQVTELLDHKLSTSQAVPVIVIQADHGARGTPLAHQVFSAVHIPSYKGNSWPDSLNSVNTFKLIFNELFGTNLTISR
ncbi:MAG: hypothetical protein KJ687_10125 [Proteobacteria bacterium]|nr:hypothetical protein [Pseudomonadota bacterium]